MEHDQLAGPDPVQCMRYEGILHCAQILALHGFAVLQLEVTDLWSQYLVDLFLCNGGNLPNSALQELCVDVLECVWCEKKKLV